MAQTIDAVYENGAFKPQAFDQSRFAEGQRVTLTIEMAPPDATSQSQSEAPPALDLVSRQKFYEEFIKEHPPSMTSNAERELRALIESQRSIFHSSHELDPSKSKMFLESVNEATEIWTGPRFLRDMIKEQFNAIVSEVRDIRPAEPANKMQKSTRTVLAYFNNLSSLFIYVILIAAALKVVFLFAGHNARIAEAFENAKYFMAPFVLMLALLCLLIVRAFHWISKFIKSYRVMSILGCVIAAKFLFKTSIVLFTATSFRAMGDAAGQLLLGALK